MSTAPVAWCENISLAACVSAASRSGANSHSCKRSPPTPIGCAIETSGPAMKPSSDMLMCATTIPIGSYPLLARLRPACRTRYDVRAAPDHLEFDTMEQRRLGNSGLSVSALSFGTMTIGGRDRFGKMGNLGVAETSRILDVCRDAGVDDDRHGGRLLLRRRRGDPRRGARGPAARVRARDQGRTCGWDPVRTTSACRAST